MIFEPSPTFKKQDLLRTFSLSAKAIPSAHQVPGEEKDERYGERGKPSDTRTCPCEGGAKGFQ